ncbi:hypothetical protein SPRG_13619 [Saprolegnia parasitica CBS 223.65]|uniref:Uncharacterized protein n=1 Tax=Saprolegnia parasitica (strain CBS 223.65) TaxID=695850 RepID=A0A067BRC6_SAPPC|nr:hypothetical protein SPRG_13619 [Saprolegnia parasitica CBS 223.65]KDO20803.1 hypothetical protein SPRG_13619 [Saprolegnia parasitica CBS 223.65]|eukprot:XP_012208462.1 hypothetical protein SPRG_13619 [Saprolegnia parasitica CBS 223.65]
MLCLNNTSIDTLCKAPPRSSPVVVQPKYLAQLSKRQNTPVVPLPACYARAKYATSLVGGKRVAFIPHQVRRLRARRCMKRISPILEDGYHPMSRSSLPVVAGPTLAMPGMSCYL